MLMFLSVGLPVAFVGLLGIGSLAFESICNHFPRLETMLEKALAFNVFELL